MGESLHCRDPFLLTVALSFWLNPTVYRPIVKWLIFNGVIGNILACDKKRTRDIGLLLHFQGRSAND